MMYAANVFSQQAHHNAELSDNQTYIAFSFIYIARAFSQKKQYNKAIEYGVNMSKKIDEINAAMHAKEKEASEE